MKNLIALLIVFITLSACQTIIQHQSKEQHPDSNIFKKYYLPNDVDQFAYEYEESYYNETKVYYYIFKIVKDENVINMFQYNSEKLLIAKSTKKMTDTSKFIFYALIKRNSDKSVNEIPAIINYLNDYDYSLTFDYGYKDSQKYIITINTVFDDLLETKNPSNDQSYLRINYTEYDKVINGKDIKEYKYTISDFYTKSLGLITTNTYLNNELIKTLKFKGKIEISKFFNN